MTGMTVARTAGMRTPAFVTASILTAGLFGHAGCAAPDGGDPEDSVAVDEGKEDNFLSASAIEYVLTGKSSVTLDAGLATASADTRMVAAKKLIGLKQVAIAWFVTEYLVDKDKAEDTNYKFGGFGGIAKGGRTS